MSNPLPMNDLDRAIVAFHRSKAALPELMRQLGESEELWFLVPYHPEVEGEAMELKPGMPLPFVQIQDEQGPQVPLFSSCERTEEAMENAGLSPRTLAPGAMAALQILEILGRAELRAVLNKSCATGELVLPANMMRDIADGSALRPTTEPATTVHGEVRSIDPADYPTDLVQAAFEVLRQHRNFRTAWIFERGREESTPAGGRRYQFLLHMEPRDAAIGKEFNVVVSSVGAPAHAVEIGYLDENNPAYIANLRQQARAFYTAPDVEPMADGEE